MSRIYQSESKANFEGSARGGSFQPKQAVDSSKAIREYKEALAQKMKDQEVEECYKRRRDR